MIGRDIDTDIHENRAFKRPLVRRLLITMIFGLVILVSLLILVNLFSENAEAEYGLQITVEMPNDQFMNASVNPQTAQFIVNITNTGTLIENVNVTVYFNDSSKPLDGWTVNPIAFSVNSLGPGLSVNRPVNVTAPVDEPAYSFAQLIVEGYPQENTSMYSSDSFIARVSPIWDAILTPHTDIFYREPGDTIRVRLQLINSGTASDTLTVEDITPAPYDNWGQVELPATNILGAGNQTIMNYTINIDSDVTIGESPIYLYLGVRSQGASDEIIENQSIIIVINQTYGVSISTTQNEKTGDPGETVVFKIRIRNDGNDEDTFSLSHSGLGDLGVWEFSQVTLQPDEYIDVNYTIVIDSDHDTSDILITLNATSIVDVSGLTFDTLDIILHVNPRYEVKLGETGGNRKDGDPGETVQFNLTVKNQGSVTDTFELEAWTLDGLYVTISNITIEVESVLNDPLNSTKIVYVWVEIDDDPPVSIGDHNIIINATSLNDPDANDTYTFTVDVGATYGVYIFSSTGSVQVDAGEDAVFPFIQVTNDGNDVDSFSFYITGLPVGWTTSPLSTLNNIPPDGTSAFDFTVYTTDSTATGSYKFNLTARSISDPTVEATIELTVEVTQVYSVELPSSVSSKDVDPGETVSYAISVKNRGNGPDIIELVLTGVDAQFGNLYYNPTENGQTIHVSPPAGGSVTVYFNVTPPADYWDTETGDIFITIEATSLDDPGASPTYDSVQVITQVNDVYDFRVSGSGSRSGIPGDIVTFSLTINNDGSTSDSYNLRILEFRTSTGGTISYWESANTNPFSINPVSVAKGGQQTIDVDIEIPYPDPLAEVPPGDYIIEVEIKSQGDSSVLTTINYTVKVKQLYAAEIVNTITSQNVDVGNFVTYTLQVKNIGNRVDNISIEIDDDGSITGDQTSWTNVTYNSMEITQILLDAGEVAWIQFTVSIPERTDPSYPSVDPISVTFPVTVSPSKPDEPGAMKVEVDIRTNINPIYEFDPNPIPKQAGEPGDTVEFSIRIKNSGTGSDTYTPELIWMENWEQYQYPPQFSPESLTLGPGQTGTITLFFTIPSDNDVALAGEYTNNVKISAINTDEQTLPFTVEVEEVFGLDLTDPATLTKSVEVGNAVTYQFRIKNTGNSQDTYVLDRIDEDTSSSGGGDQSSWASFALASAPSVKITSVILGAEDSETVIFTIDVPAQNDPNFVELPNPLEMTVVVRSEGGTNLDDQFTTSTTVEPIYTFEFSSTDDDKDGEPGDSLNFTLQIKNTGTVTDTYNFRVTSVDESIFIVPNPDPIINLGVDSYNITHASVSITTDMAKALAGLYQIEITVDSSSDPSVSDSIILTVDINPLAEVELTPSTQGYNGEPWVEIDYSIKVRNLGNAQDTFGLTLNGTYKDWAEIFDNNMNPISEVTLTATGTPGYFYNIIIRVTIPSASETNAGQNYPITVKAFSTNTENVYDAATVTTTVDQFVDLDLEYSGGGTPEKTHDPNKITPKFPFRVTNYGNQDESAVEIRVDDIDANWDYTPKTLSDTLNPGQSSTFSLEFIIPNDAPEGDYDMQVFVVSSNDPTEESDPITITVTVAKPDLVISSGDISGLEDTDHLKEKVGSQITITIRVNNEGTSSAESVLVKLYEGISVKDSITISSVASEGYEDIEFKWVVVAEEVDLKIEAGPIEEINVENNDETVYLDLRPDLSFYGEEINFSKSNPKPNETVVIRTFIKNSGGDAEDVGIRFLWGEKVIGVKTADIGYNEVEEVSIEWIVPDRPNETLSVKAEIDHSDSKGDGSEATRSIAVGEKEKTEVEPPATTPKGEESDQVDYFLFILGLVIGIIACILGFLFGRMGKREPDLPQEQYPPMAKPLEQQMQEGPEEQKPENPSQIQPQSPPPPQPVAPEQVNFETVEKPEINEPDQT